MPDRVVPLRPAASEAEGGETPICRLDRVSLERGGRRLLERIDMAIPRGRISVLLGPNGAGKSLALRLIAGLETPSGGTLTLAPGLEAKHVGLVLQQPVFLRRSVHANLAHALALAGTPRRERVGRIAELLVRADLAHAAARPARALSGGEQQRLAIVRALALEPRLLLLDEPTSSLDPQATRAVEALIGEIRNEGTTILLVTHDVAQARRLAERVIFLADGRVRESGPADSFFDAPRSRAAAAYLEGRLPEEAGDAPHS